MKKLLTIAFALVASAVTVMAAEFPDISIADLKKALEGSDRNAIQTAVTALEQAMQAFGQAAQAAGGPQGGASGGGEASASSEATSDEDIKDADFEVKS